MKSSLLRLSTCPQSVLCQDPSSLDEDDPIKLCANPCVMALLACKDDPQLGLMKDMLAPIEMICDHSDADCRTMITDLQTQNIFGDGGVRAFMMPMARMYRTQPLSTESAHVQVCCDPANGVCDSQEPTLSTSCSSTCAGVFAPFWETCGSWME
jgi:hypothetical protein